MTAMRTVLHYVGYDHDAGGIVSVVRALAGAGEFACVLGVNRGFTQRRSPPLATLELPALDGERLGLRTLWRARTVAARVAEWLGADPQRMFHGHSRAGLAVALWLARRGERRMVASVHCYGRQRRFYRWAARRLGRRLYWLSPAMKRYYGVAGPGEPWDRCVPGCVASDFSAATVFRPRVTTAVRVGGVGALVHWKGWHLVLEALAALPSAMRDKLRFTHIGGTDGSAEAARYARTLREQTAALGLADRVEWRGEQPSAGEFLRQQDCLVIASHQEPFSIAMIEALAAGVPVLAADSGGATDILAPPFNGWLFRSGDVPDLTRALVMLAETDALATVRIKPENLRRFSAAAVAPQWRDIYAGLSALE